jgi:transposase
MVMSDNLFWLSEGQMEGLRPLLPDKVRGVPRADDRRVISGIVHVLKSGCRWADAPSAYGPKKTLYNRWRRWAEKGSGPSARLVRIFEALADAGGPPAQVLIDSSAVSAHRSASGGKGVGGAGDRPIQGRVHDQGPLARGPGAAPSA